MNVFLEKMDNFAIIFLNNKKKKNALDFDTSRELVDISVNLSQDEDVKVVVITGSEGIFCAGGDIKEFAAGVEKSPVDHFKDMDVNVKVFKYAEIIRKPVIAAVEGYAFGGGFGLVAASHIAVASPSAKFGMPEINLGIFPYCIFPYVKRAIGERLAVKLALTGEIFDADFAKELGLIHYIEKDPLKKAVEIAENIAKKSPVVLKMAMDVIGMERGKTLSDDYLAILRIINFKTNDLKEGIEAFLQKRKPKWEGK